MASAILKRLQRAVTAAKQAYRRQVFVEKQREEKARRARVLAKVKR